jgi:hypothetical protein
MRGHLIERCKCRLRTMFDELQMMISFYEEQLALEIEKRQNL